MSRKPVTQDSGRSSDWGSHVQTDKPWKGNPEKEQRSGDAKRSGDEEPDLEKWHESNTH
ncbi:hypothetical protein QA639_05200 [Bradyrhizobium pachyrhizi]|uniref:hypothetical protein n=1 Tax=Bradyrhizobium TaxID=374 RepID=UPI000B0769BF|nr:MULTISPECIES: hypothetical protein [Bradyrhizobium]WFU56923.1 hypothetical protein QA639_05200 [Bradyrhizobium pachyrhizi]WOH82562.1 hypothetical protein RX327_05110 [Bradyrhizobium sp. BEA-2-5]